jgi:valyl-tRNA synthetase
LTKSQIQFTNLAEKKEKNSAFSLIDVNPFGVLKIVEKSPKLSTETKKKIKYYQAEQQRSQKLLANKNFVEKAPS